MKRMSQCLLRSFIVAVGTSVPNIADNSFRYPEGMHEFSVPEDLMQAYLYRLGLYEDALRVF